MKVIVGLGNPGREYERTRHNVGWWVVDHLADVWRFDPWKKDGEARVSSGTLLGARVRLLKPQTYMNLSGQALRRFARRPAWSAAHDLLVVLDEVHLPIGRYRFRAKGSSGGHNGLKSIEAELGAQEYARLRIGVGRDDEWPPVSEKKTLSDYVLGEFGKREAADVRELLPTFVEAAELWLREGILAVMNRFPGKVPKDNDE